MPPERPSATPFVAEAASSTVRASKVLAEPAVQKAVVLLSDLCAITLSHAVAMRVLVRAMHIDIGGQAPFEYHRYYIPYFALMLWLVGGYKSLQLRRPEQELEQGCKAVSVSFLGLILFNFLIFRSGPFSRYSIVLWFCLSTILMLTGRFSLRGVYGILWRRGLCRRRALLVGTGRGITEYWQLLNCQRHPAYEYVGVLLDGHSLRVDPEAFLGLRLLGDISEWRTALTDFGVNLLIVEHTGDLSDEDWLQELVHCCKLMRVDVELYSTVLAMANLAHEQDEFSGCFRFYAKPKWSLRVQRIAKRGIDIALGFVGSAVTVVVIPIVYVLVNYEDPGPVFHLREYVGKDGQIHYYRKFRTMVTNADAILEHDHQLKARFLHQHKLKDDPRLLKVGKIMRRYSIDEFPQFFNLLTGSLTFVGPRVISAEERIRYGAQLSKLLSAKPGLTGFWQIMGRQTTTYEERIRMDMFYIDRWSIWLDLIIIAKTLWKVVSAEGAY